MNVAERARSPPASSGVCGRVTEGQRECPHSRKPALSFLWAAGMSSASLGEQRPWAPCGDLPVWPHGPSPSQLGAAPVEDTPQPASLPLTVALGVRTLQGLSHLQPRRQRVLTEGRGQPRASAPPATPAAAPSARSRQHRHAAPQAAARLSGGPTPARPISAPVRNQSPQLRGGRRTPAQAPTSPVLSCLSSVQSRGGSGVDEGRAQTHTHAHAHNACTCTHAHTHMCTCTQDTCTHVHTHVHTYAHTMHAYAHTCTCSHVHTCMHMYTHRDRHRQAHAHTCTHACKTHAHVRTHTHKHACMHMHAHTCVHKCSHTCTCTHTTHTHTHMPFPWFSPSREKGAVSVHLGLWNSGDAGFEGSRRRSWRFPRLRRPGVRWSTVRGGWRARLRPGAGDSPA